MPRDIREVVITTANSDATVHIAPMGIWQSGEEHVAIAPYRPSHTLDNLLRDCRAVINCCDDVRIFAGCLTGRRDWPVCALSGAAAGPAWRLQAALSHSEVQMVDYQPDAQRPVCLCTVHRHVNHAPFSGFNRAQAAVLEAAILLSRRQLLAPEKIEREIEYLRIAIDKTAGERELQAWAWLMEALDDWRRGRRGKQRSVHDE